MVSVFRYLKYNAGFLTGLEKDILKINSISIPENWRVMPRENPMLFKLKVGKGEIFFVPFPEETSEFQEVCKKINLLAKRINLNNNGALIIGLSAWGADLEKRYLELPGCSVHVLLGAGKGFGTRGKVVNNGHTLWIRPYSRGKAVNLLKILKFPRQNPDWQWRPGDNVILDVCVLNERVPSDEKILNLLKDVRE